MSDLIAQYIMDMLEEDDEDKLYIHAICTAQGHEAEAIIKSHHTTVAVDVLRATTAICAAFQSGVKEVVPLDSLEPLSEFHKNGYLRAAERGGRKIGEAECGNSPTEYLTMDLRGQRIA